MSGAVRSLLVRVKVSSKNCSRRFTALACQARSESLSTQYSGWLSSLQAAVVSEPATTIAVGAESMSARTSAAREREERSISNPPEQKGRTLPGGRADHGHRPRGPKCLQSLGFLAIARYPS